jgi:hypothetical protein
MAFLGDTANVSNAPRWVYTMYLFIFCALLDEVVTIRSEHAQRVNLAALDMDALNATRPERDDVCSANRSRGAGVVIRKREKSALKVCRVGGGIVDFHFLALIFSFFYFTHRKSA